MVDSTLQYTLKTERRLNIAIITDRHKRCRLIDKFCQLATQALDVTITGLQNFMNFGNIE